MVSIIVRCPRCQSARAYRHVQDPQGYDRFRCRDCHRVFQLDYSYEARKQGIKKSKSRRWLLTVREFVIPLGH